METKSLFCVPVRQLDRGDQRLSWPIPTDWLDQQLAGTEARAGDQVGRLDLYLTKDKQRILVKGAAEVTVELKCARTQEPFKERLHAPILLLLSPLAGEQSTQRRKRAPQQSRKSASPRPERGKDAALPGDLLSAEEAAEDHYAGDTVELDAFVREHILLELPLFPVRSDLPSAATTATHTGFDVVGATGAQTLDPRLAPLEAIARELRGDD